MRTIETKVYQFSELTNEAKEAAIDQCRYYQHEYEWWEFIYEDAENIGLKITSFGLDRNRHAKGEFLLSACEVAANIVKGHGDGCGTLETAINFLEEWQPLFTEYMDESSEHYENSEREYELMELETEFLESLLEEYSIILENEAEWLTSDESVQEFIEANGYEFYDNGNVY